MESSTGRRAFGRGADAAITLGVAGAVSAAATGLTDWQHLTGESRRTGMSHALFNTLALGLFIGSLVSRKGKNRGMGRVLALAGLSAATAGAYLGGDLVFRQKVGVNHAPEGVDTPRFEPVMAEADLPDNTLKRAYLNDVPLVLLRRGEQIYALAETCAHLGGPLADGEIGENDDEGHPSVICPWHGSTFALNDGRIITGPSAYPQPCFETRVRNSQIEVRRHAQG
jgi:nitrite reductase/ring-hydroxylating ferredoxin subunit